MHADMGPPSPFWTTGGISHVGPDTRDSQKLKRYMQIFKIYCGSQIGGGGWLQLAAREPPCVTHVVFCSQTHKKRHLPRFYFASGGVPVASLLSTFLLAKMTPSALFKFFFFCRGLFLSGQKNNNKKTQKEAGTISSSKMEPYG